MSSKVYAKVEGGKIVEYPVLPIHIQNRAHPLSWYTEVIFDDKPEVPEFHYLHEEVIFKRGEVIATYTVKPMTLDSLLAELWGHGQVELPAENFNVTIDQVPMPTIQRIAQLATELVQVKLDNFAKERNYDSIVSAASYIGSQNPTFKADAERAVLMRDQAWAALYGYMAKVTSGQVPVPKTADDILVDVPAFTWE